MDASRTIRLVVRPRDRRATRLVTEGGQMVDYGDGGQVAEVEQIEALQKLATGNFDALEALTDNEQAYVDAMSSKTWAPLHGRYPRPSDFQL